MSEYELVNKQCDVKSCGSWNVIKTEGYDNHAFGCPDYYKDYICLECGRMIGTSGLSVRQDTLDYYKQKAKSLKKPYHRSYFREY